MTKNHDPRSALTSTQVQAKLYNLERGMEELGLAPTYPKGTLFPGGLPNPLFEPTDWKLELIDKDELSKLTRSHERYEFLKQYAGRAAMETLGCAEGEDFDRIVDKMMGEKEI